MDTFGRGIYKFIPVGQSAYFFLDYRDTRYGSYSNIPFHTADIWIRYNASSGSFSYRNNGPDMNNLDGTDWIPISNGQYLPIWVIKEQSNYGSPRTSSFPNFWDNALAVITEPNNHPVLVWGPNQDHLVTGYRIYRRSCFN